MNVDVILGLQWGDEGKGKIVDVLTPRYDVIARFQGGPNAGHTIEFDHRKFVLHTIPSGIFHAEKTNVIGNGVIIDPFIFFQEVDNLLEAGIHPEKKPVDLAPLPHDPADTPPARCCLRGAEGRCQDRFHPERDRTDVHG